MYLSKWTMTAEEYSMNFMFNRYIVHQYVCDIFDEPSVKFQLSMDKGHVNILIQSVTSSKKLPSFGKILSKPIDINLFTTGTYRIEVDLNSIRQISIEDRKRSKKIPVVGNDVIQWVNDRASRWGIECVEVIVNPTKTDVITKGSNRINCRWHKITIVANVMDVNLFHEMILKGIGSQRAFGFGMVKAIKILPR